MFLKYAAYTVLSLALGITALNQLDKYATAKATAYLVADDSPIYDRVSASDIDWEGPNVQACVFDWVWGIYPYQTCYRRKGPSGENNSEKAFVFLLTGPSRIFTSPWNYLAGRTPESYRFTLPVRTRVAYVFYADGTAIDRLGANVTD